MLRCLPDLMDVKQLDGEDITQCALLEDGHVKCWEMGAGAGSTCALIADGGVMCWGLNSHVQLGNGGARSPMEPARVVELEDVVQITGGARHYCAVTRTNTVRCWRFGNDYQLGNGDDRLSASPVVVRFAD